jgi:hypothetical protein
VSRIFSFSHTNEFCGICAEATEPAATYLDKSSPRRAIKGLLYQSPVNLGRSLKLAIG